MTKKKEQLSAKERLLMEDLLHEKFEEQHPDPVFKTALFGKLAREYHREQKRQQQKSEGFWENLGRALQFWFRSFTFLTSLTFLIIAFGVTAGYAYLSPNVNRESHIYALKTSIESMELALTFSEEGKSEKYMKMAERRFSELEILLEKGVLDTHTLGEVSRNIAEAMEAIDNIEDPAERAVAEERLRAKIEEQKNGLRALLDSVEALEEGLTDHESGSPSADSVLNEIGEMRSIEENLEGRALLPNLSMETTFDRQGVPKEVLSGAILLKNTGDGEAKNIFLQVDWGDGKEEAWTIGFLFPGEEEKILLYHSFVEPGSYDIEISIDPKGVVVEEDEGDNLAEHAVRIEVSCDHVCETLGERRCDGNAIESCTTDTNGCRVWEAEETCSGTMACEEGACIQTCQSTCTPGSFRCSGEHATESCQKNSLGCYSWVAQEICQSDEACNNGTCQTACTNECALGDRRCDGNDVFVCEQAGSCTVWVRDQICVDGMSCRDGNCQ